MSGKKVVSVTALMLLISVLAFAGSSSKYYPPSNPWFDATGGPDAYGYEWIDSDEPGGPVYEWIDITATGTQLIGMGDDDYQGPFDLGFDYDYYWYTVNEVYIGSNGYLKFPPPYNEASPFPASIPLTADPNDYLAIYLGDLDPTAGGEIWYWSNDVDQFIVSFIQTPCWNLAPPFGEHTFQVIIDGSDNTITYNYGYNEGEFYNTDIIIGIENVNGQVGLMHSADSYIPHNDYTVVFTRPDSTTYEVHDFGIKDLLNTGSKAIFVEEDSSYSPVVWVQNFGNQAETGADLRVTITNDMGANVYTENVTVSALAAGEIEEITTSEWTPAYVGQYTIATSVRLIGDMNSANDAKDAMVINVEVPGELAYDDGSSETGMAWNGEDGGYAQYFESIAVPAEITLIRYYISQVADPFFFTAQILDDDGTDGAPGSVLFEQVVDCPTGAQWYQTVPTGITDDNGKFYVVWLQPQAQAVYMGIDQDMPTSRQCWEFTSGWAPYRDGEVEDAMIRVMVGQGTLPEPVIDVSLDSLIFGTVTIGDTETVNLMVYNIGSSGDLIIDDLTLTGVPPTIIIDIEGFTAGVHIEPGDSIELLVNFHPLLPTTSTGTLNFINNTTVNPFYVYFSGTGQTAGVNDPDIGIPVQYGLSQNYPNPFNSQTSLAFSLPAAGEVSLAVYDLQGRIVAELAQGWYTEGTHAAYFDASELASGVYLARFTAGNFQQTQKMLFVK